MHISLNNEWILIIQTPLFSGKIEFLSDVKIFEKNLDFKNGLLYLVMNTLQACTVLRIGTLTGGPLCRVSHSMCRLKIPTQDLSSCM